MLFFFQLMTMCIKEREIHHQHWSWSISLPPWSNDTTIMRLFRPGGVSCRTDREKKKTNSFPLVVIFYSFCPLELSICIDAVGNPINEREKKSRTMYASVKSIVSRADINDVFLIYILLNRCVSLLTKKKMDYHSVDDGHRHLVISSGTMNRTDRQEEEERKRNWMLIAFVQHHLILSSRHLVCQSLKNMSGGTIRTRLWKKKWQYSLSILVS